MNSSFRPVPAAVFVRLVFLTWILLVGKQRKATMTFADSGRVVLTPAAVREIHGNTTSFRPPII